VGDETEMVPLRGLVRDCPRALETALRWALHRDPDERVDAKELLAQLDEATEEMNEGQLAAEMDEPADVVAPGSPVASASTAAPMTVGQGAAGSAPARSWKRRVGSVALVAAISVAGWWGGRVTAPRPAAIATASPESGVVRPPPAERPREATGRGPTLPTMREALDAASVGLRRCAELGESPLFIEFTTLAGLDKFAAVVVRGNSDDKVDRCVADAIATIRFEPTDPETFTEDYMP
jgi:hypothetical protein